MNETDLINDLPAWIKYMAGASGFMAAALLWLRQWLSSAKVDRTADAANAATIERLQVMLNAANTRADEITRQRDQLVGEIGELRGEVTALRAEVAAQHKQIEVLLALMKKPERSV